MAPPSALSVVDAPFSQVVSVSVPLPPGPDLPSPVSSVLLKDASKRKRVNRNARLKQCKLDARREQWLSQVTSIKHGKEKHHEQPVPENDDLGDVLDLETCKHSTESQHYNSKASERSFICSHLRIERQESGEQVHNDSEKSSPSGSSVCTFDGSEASFSLMSICSESPKSKPARVGKNHEWLDQKRENEESFERVRVSSLIHDTDNVDGHGDMTGSASCKLEDQGSESEEEDWEAVADALGVDWSKDENLKEMKGERCSPHVEHAMHPAATGSDVLSIHGQVSRSCSSKAWRPDDVSRPASLPNINKQQSLPIRLTGQIPQWINPRRIIQDLPSMPSVCPICAEELDNTDSSFEPCICGFQLCLFCHHRIASDDGRCPGCRRPYTNANLVRSLC